MSGRQGAPRSGIRLQPMKNPQSNSGPQKTERPPPAEDHHQDPLPKLSPWSSGDQDMLARAPAGPAAAGPRRRMSPLDPLVFAQEVMPDARTVAAVARRSSHPVSHAVTGTGNVVAGGGAVPHLKAALVPLVSSSPGSSSAASPLSEFSRKMFASKERLAEAKEPPAKSVEAAADGGGAADDRRKATPPDLLELSNMYFDRQQKIMATRGSGFRAGELSQSHRISR